MQRLIPRFRHLGTYLLLVMTVMAAGAAVVGVWGIRQTSAMHRQVVNARASEFLPLLAIDTIRAAGASARVTVINHVNGDGQTGAEVNEQLKALDASVESGLSSFRAAPLSGSGEAYFIDRIARDWKIYTQFRDAAVSKAGDGQREAARRAVNGFASSAFASFDNDVAALAARLTSDASRRAQLSGENYQHTRLITVAVVILSTLLSAFLGILISRSIVRPIRAVMEALKGLADGKVTGSVTVDRRDEIGEMADALNTAIRQMRSMVQTIHDNAGRLGAAADGLTTLNSGMAGTAGNTSSLAKAAATAADQVNSNIQAVTTGSLEMNDSISQIAHSATDAARVAADGVAVAGDTTERMVRLVESSNQIGAVLEVISAIAKQTNLLALNATIEAARAGESGKGFAVVAGEVKELAQETARATEDISRQIQAIQTDTTDAVEAIRGISDVIERINGFQATIASAVEEQTATTEAITRSVTAAAASAAEIASNIHSVAEAARDTTQSVDSSEEAARRLAELSTDLRRSVDSFQF